MYTNQDVKEVAETRREYAPTALCFVKCVVLQTLPKKSNDAYDIILLQYLTEWKASMLNVVIKVQWEMDNVLEYWWAVGHRHDDIHEDQVEAKREDDVWDGFVWNVSWPSKDLEVSTCAGDFFDLLDCFRWQLLWSERSEEERWLMVVRLYCV